MSNIFKNKKVLFLAPHTDDVELGCGATLARVIEEGGDVYIAAFSTARQSLPPNTPSNQLEIEFRSAMDVYGVDSTHLFVYDYEVRKLNFSRQDVLENMIELKNQIDPHWVFLPSGNDLHQDHQVVFNEGLRAFKDRTIWGYELPWNHISFNAQGFIKVELRHIENKWLALQEYKSQIVKKRPYFEKTFIEGVAKMRGVQINETYAEAFEVVRIKF